MEWHDHLEKIREEAREQAEQETRELLNRIQEEISIAKAAKAAGEVQKADIAIEKAEWLIDSYYMRSAIDRAKLSATLDNEPFGAVLVKDSVIVAYGENEIYRHGPTFHAELGLIRDYMEQNHLKDLSEYTLYTSCEPCFMCSGAMVWAKLGRLVYAASNADLEKILGNEGCSTSEIVFANSFWKPKVTGGVLRDEAVKLLSEYFATHAKG